MSEVNTTEKNRWLIAVSAVLIHLSIGSIYAYSVYQTPLQALHGWSNSEVTLAFSAGLFVLGLTAASMGWFVEKYGPRLSGLISAVIFGAGIVGAGVSVQVVSLPLFIATFGVLGGVGLGIGYIAPVSTLVAWFPDKRGLATGMAVMGFGGGALVTGPAAKYLMTRLSSPSHPTFIDVLTLADGTEVLEIVLPADSPAVGESFGALRESELLPEEVVVVSIERDGEIIRPTDGTSFEADDVLTLLPRGTSQEKLLESMVGSE